jgi:hypothetical protein
MPMQEAALGAALSGDEPLIPMIQIKIPPLSAKSGLAHFRWIDYRRVLTTQQETALEAKKVFHTRLLMSLNTESEQDPILR